MALLDACLLQEILPPQPGIQGTSQPQPQPTLPNVPPTLALCKPCFPACRREPNARPCASLTIVDSWVAQFCPIPSPCPGLSKLVPATGPLLCCSLAPDIYLQIRLPSTVAAPSASYTYMWSPPCQPVTSIPMICLIFFMACILRNGFVCFCDLVFLPSWAVGQDESCWC